jgi:3-oxoadipate enol-lactonase
MAAQATETITDEIARTRDGTRISYRLIPGPQAHRFVLIHSLAMDKSFWDRVVASFAGSGEILVLDCRGHGRSDKPSGPYSIEQFGDDVADVMDHVGWPSAIVAGASMGGCVTLAFATRHSARVRGLGLFDTTAWYGETAPQDWAQRATKAESEGLAALVAFQQTRWFSDEFRAANPEIVAQAVSVFLANDLPAYVATCHMLGVADLRGALASFNFPCEIRVGSQDYATPPEMAEHLARSIPGAHLEILKDRRHLSPIEAPDRIAEALRLLAARVDAVGAKSP